MRRAEPKSLSGHARTETIEVPGTSVLILTQDQSYSLRLNHTLRRSQPAARLTTVASVADVLAVLSARRVDLVLLDQEISEAGGLDALVQLRGLGLDVPIVFVCGTSSDAILEARRLGAVDYIVKDDIYLPLLPPIVERAIEKTRQER